MQKFYKYILLVVLVGCYLASWWIDVVDFGYSHTSEWWTRFSYLFFHGSWWHLLFNGFAMYAFLKVMGQETVFSEGFLLLSALIGGVLGTFGSEYALPTIGISGSVFFLLGMRAYYYRELNWVRSVVAILCAQLITPFFSMVNVKVHSLCFIYGIGYIFLISNIKKYLRRKKNEKTMETYQTLH